MGSVLIMLNFFVVKGKECTKLLYQFLQFVRNKRIEQNEEEQSNRQCTKNREIKLVRHSIYNKYNEKSGQ